MIVLIDRRDVGAPDPAAGPVELPDAVRRVGASDLGDGGGLGDGDVVEYAERADHDPGEQQALHVDVVGGAERRRDVVGDAGQVQRGDRRARTAGR